MTVHRYPADGRARFWTTPSFLEWEAEAATLRLLEAGREELLCDFAAIPISLIQRSIPAEGEFEVVAPGGSGGKAQADYEGLDVRGKLVLTGEPVGRRGRAGDPATRRGPHPVRRHGGRRAH